MSKLVRHPIAGLLTLVLAVAFALGARWLWIATHVGAGYAAKVTCSLVFNSGQDSASVFRNYVRHEIAPLFAFGHGLSYTTFEYSDLTVTRGDSVVEVRLRVTNTGSMRGAEVVQVYVSDDESSLPRPAKELKAFDKVELAPGESAELTLVLGDDAFSYYDPDRAGWVLEPGTFTIRVGSSSRDLRASGQIEL